MKDGRIAAIDVLRGIAIAAVVARHVSWRMLTPATLASPGGDVVAAVHLASGFGVPLFVTLSAFALAWRHPGPLGGLGGYARFLFERASRLLPAYVLWSLASLAARDLSLLADPGGVASALLHGTADVQFYFVPMIFELYVLWPLLRLLVVRRRLAAAFVVLAGGAAAGDLLQRGLLWRTWTVLGDFAAPVAAAAVLCAAFIPRRQDGKAAAAPAFPSALRAGQAAMAALLAAAAATLLWVMVRDYLALTAGNPAREILYWLATVLARRPVAYALLVTGALSLAAGVLARTATGRLLAALGRESYGIFLVHLLVASTFVYRFFGLDDAAMGAVERSGKLVAVWAVTLAASHVATTLLARSARTAWMMGGAGRRGLLREPVARGPLP